MVVAIALGCLTACTFDPRGASGFPADQGDGDGDGDGDGGDSGIGGGDGPALPDAGNLPVGEPDAEPQPIEPDPCDDCPGACSAETGCVVTCANGQCTSPITCPAGLPCTVRCQGNDTCSAGVDCSAASSCDIQCSGRRSCAGALACGRGSCAITCEGRDSCRGGIDCQDACECEVRCEESGTCDPEASCPEGCADDEGCRASGGDCESSCG